MASWTAPEWHPAFEEYCEAIFELREDDVEVIQARIAERLEVSRPAVSEMIRRLEGQGLVQIDRGRIDLTDSGRELGERVVRRHRLAERLLTDVLGLSWSEAHAEAGKWEHVISDRVEGAIVHLLGEPTTCPHGNPIPGSGYQPPDAVALARVATGGAFTITRIPEELEFTPGLLEFLEHAALVPGAHGVVASAGTSGGLVVEVDGQSVDVDDFAAERILVLSTALVDS
jgi:DtxR family transcriptional regulator, Mn-dependent transcriptional regulator